MRHSTVIVLLLALVSQVSAGEDAVVKVATRYVPGITWRAKSVVTGDFTCRGRKQTAILGTSSSEIVVAVFLNGPNKRPEVIHDRSSRDAASVELTTEDLDYEVDYALPGFQRSKTCKGLVLDDGEVDPAHLYWNHESLRFDSWSNGVGAPKELEIGFSNRAAIIHVSEAAMSTQPKTLLTPEEYLEIERNAEYKSEYYDGVMYAMAGVRAAHDLITWNLHGELRNCFRSRGCLGFTSDMRVRTFARHYTYPDSSALCGEPQFLDERQDTLLNPSLIVKVLSPSTEAYDRGRKFELYQSISSLREYLLLASDRVHADLYTRQASGLWLLASAGELDDVLVLESVGCPLNLAGLYEKVEFDAAQERPA